MDSQGLCRIAHGHHPGSQNDIAAYYSSDLYLDPNAYLGTDSKMLVDGIFSRIERGPSSRFITPICFMRRELTIPEARYNMIQAWDRLIVEHHFGRLKLYFSFINQFTLHETAINLSFRSACILTNIIIKLQSPLRATWH